MLGCDEDKTCLFNIIARSTNKAKMLPFPCKNSKRGTLYMYNTTNMLHSFNFLVILHPPRSPQPKVERHMVSSMHRENRIIQNHSHHHEMSFLQW